jgi:hypothetical protein
MKKILLTILFAKTFYCNAQLWLNASANVIAGEADGYLDYKMEMNNDTPFVSYGGIFNGQITLKKLKGNAWLPAGPQLVLPSTSGSHDLAFVNGTGYIIYEESGGNINVKKLVGNGWQNVGPSNFASGSSTRIAHYNNTLYIAFNDNSAAGKVTVKKFNGTNWINVGSPGFSETPQQAYIKLAFSEDGTPYIAYELPLNSPIYVKKFNGTSWENIGGPSTRPCSNLSSFIVKENTVYIAYDVYRENQSKVRFFDGVRWRDHSVFENATEPSLVLRNDTLYAAVLENLNLTFKKFRYGKWVNAYAQPIRNIGGTNLQPRPQLLFNSTTPYVLFEDRSFLKAAYLDSSLSCNPHDSLNVIAITPTTATTSVNQPYAANGYTLQYQKKGSKIWSTVATSATPESMEIENLDDTTHYLGRALLRCNVNSSYQFYDTVEFRTGNCGLIYDVTQNNSYEGAAIIPLNKYFNGSIEYNSDTDYYKIVLTEPEKVRITLYDLPYNYNLYLYTAALVLRASSENSGTTDETFSRGLPKGISYIKVIASNPTLYNPLACYKIRASIVDDAGKISYNSSGDAIQLQKNNQLSLFPNPAHSVVNIKGVVPAGSFISIRNSVNILMQHSAVTNSAINIDKLNLGVYIVCITDREGTVLLRTKMIKQ